MLANTCIEKPGVVIVEDLKTKICVFCKQSFIDIWKAVKKSEPTFLLS
jgi:hypothetical protein